MAFSLESLIAVAIGIGLAAATGFRIFLPLLLAGLAARWGHLQLAEGFQWLSSSGPLIALGTASVVEVGAYYSPVVDHVLDVVAGPAAVLAGVLASASAMVDIPPGIGTLYAERQWGAAFEASRPLLNPLLRSWKGSSLTGAIRADAVDLDRAILGDSRMRVSASLNARPRAGTVARAGWYYERRRDRFNNETPAAGLTLSLSSYF